MDEDRADPFTLKEIKLLRQDPRMVIRRLLATIDAMHAELERHSESVDCDMMVDW